MKLDKQSISNKDFPDTILFGLIISKRILNDINAFKKRIK